MARPTPARGSSRAARTRSVASKQALRTATGSNGAPIRSNAALTTAQIRFLRGQAHELKALLQIGGKGVTGPLLAEVDAALEHHELIKVRIAAEDRDARDAMIAELAGRSGAALVQRIGYVAVLYRPSIDRRRIVLPRGQGED